MNKPSDQISSPVFGVPVDELDRLGIGSIANILTAGTDIAVVVTKDGTIRDVNFQDSSLNNYGLKFWAGKNLRDIVTAECTDKIERLLKDAAKPGVHGGYQVNHSSANLPDLPVKYSVIHEKHWDHLLLLGEDLRQLMAMQQRLVQTQLDLETEYRSLQENEVRYRTVFQLLPQPLALIDGTSKTIVDANVTFAALFEEPVSKLMGKPLAGLFKRSANEPVIDAISEARHSGKMVQIDSRSARSGNVLTLEMTPYREHGAANILLSASDYEQTGKNHRPPSMAALSILDNLPEAVIAMNPKGTVTNVNDRFLDLLKLANSSLIIGRNANNWIGASPVDLQLLLSKLKDESRIKGFSTTIKDQLGGETAVMLSASSDPGTGEVFVIVSSVASADNQIAIQRLGRSEEAGGFAELVGRVPMKDLVRESLDVIEKMCIETALDQTRNNRASAAELLGLSRQSLYIKLRKHGLEDYRPGNGTQH